MSWSWNLTVCFFFRSVILFSNGTVLITQVKPRNTGTYKCVGRGLTGSNVALEASLLIAGTHTTHTHTHILAVVEVLRDKHLWLCKLRARGAFGLHIYPALLLILLSPPFLLLADLSYDTHIPLLTSGPAVPTTHSLTRAGAFSCFPSILFPPAVRLFAKLVKLSPYCNSTWHK